MSAPPPYEDIPDNKTAAKASDVKTENPNLVKLDALCKKMEISAGHKQELLKLNEYYIRFIIDDSGSMCADIKDENGKIIGTRYSELKERCLKIFDLVTLVNDNGIDFYFLNKAGLGNLKTKSELENKFKEEPSGFTPLAAAVRTIRKNTAELMKLHNKKLLVVTFTDGLPTNSEDEADVEDFIDSVVKERKEKSYHTINSCTDNEEDVSWMHTLDKKLDFLDVNDDYKTEKAQVLEREKKAGKKFPAFTEGNFLVKQVLGGAVPKLDALDE